MESPLTWTEWCHPHLCSTPCLNSFFVLVKVPFFSTLLTTAFRERREGKGKGRWTGKGEWHWSHLLHHKQPFLLLLFCRCYLIHILQRRWKPSFTNRESQSLLLHLFWMQVNFGCKLWTHTSLTLWFSFSLLSPMQGKGVDQTTLILSGDSLQASPS